MNALSKCALIALMAIMSAFAALTGEAASSAEAAAKAAQSMRLAPSDTARMRILDFAITRVETSWARPLRWHAGALETLAALYGARYDLSGDESALRQSSRLSANAVKLAPVQPNAWTRLAHLANAGIANDVCDARACIATSYQMARMQEAESACVRLKIASAIETIGAADPRVSDFAMTARSTRQLAQCLSFLPQSDIFRLILNYRRGR